MIESVIKFLKEIEKFKTCERTCQTTQPGRAESDAEHSWHLCIFIMLLEKELQPLDFVKLLKMALIHDLPEIYAGDTNPYRGDTTHKEENEKKASEALFSTLPGEMGMELKSLFDEYQQQKSAESKVVKAADKLMPLIQNLCTNSRHSSYRELNVKYEEVAAYMDKFQYDGVLQNFYERLLSEARRSSVFACEEGLAELIEKGQGS